MEFSENPKPDQIKLYQWTTWTKTKKAAVLEDPQTTRDASKQGKPTISTTQASKTRRQMQRERPSDIFLIFITRSTFILNCSFGQFKL